MGMGVGVSVESERCCFHPVSVPHLYGWYQECQCFAGAGARLHEAVPSLQNHRDRLSLDLGHVPAVTSRHVMLCRVMLRHIMSCYVMSHHVMLCHFMLCHVMSYQAAETSRGQTRFHVLYNSIGTCSGNIYYITVDGLIGDCRIV